MSFLKIKSGAILLLALALAACESKVPTDFVVTISTSKGDFKLILYDETPKHKESFLKLAGNGNYDSTRFHRVIDKFMIQGGDLKELHKNKNLWNRVIPEEINPKFRHKRGALGAARQGDNINPKRSSSTQFYVVTGRKYSSVELTTDVVKLNNGVARYLQSVRHTDLLEEFTMLQDSGRTEELQARIFELKEDIATELNLNLDKKGVSQEEIDIYTTIGGAPHLDGAYTIFGEVIEGMDTVDEISKVEVDEHDIPVEPILIKMIVEELPKTEISTLYGVVYPVEEE